jgi:echinoderm microtubule-associated protein-like 6
MFIYTNPMLLVLFAMFDFEELTLLTREEIVLAFRSCLSGLSKLCCIEAVPEESIESLVSSYALFKKDDASRMTREDFLSFCVNSPEISSWLEYFEDLEISISNPWTATAFQQVDTALAIPAPTPLTLKQATAAEEVKAKRLPWENVMPLLVNSRLTDDEAIPPQENFHMDWVYGFNGLVSRQSVYYTHRGEVAYPAGAIVILQNIQLHSQRHFTHHRGIVLCLKLFHTGDGSKTIIATGELAEKPCVHVWDSESLSIITTVKDFHTVGVSQLDFSTDRKQLITLGMDEYHSVAVYDWVARTRLFSSKTTCHAVHDIRYLSDDIFATCGYQHVSFWKRQTRAPATASTHTCTYRKYRGSFGPNSSTTSAESIHCIAIIAKHVVSGSSNGMIHIWDGRNLIRSIKAHEGKIVAFYQIQGQQAGLMSACDHGRINIWNQNMESTAFFDLGAEIAINSICWNLITSRILVASSSSCEIFEIHAIDGKKCAEGLHVTGHAHATVASLSAHPFIPHLLCTISDDEYVRVFHAKTHRMLQYKYLGCSGRCVSYSPDGQRILIGMGSKRKAGSYIMLSEEKLAVLHEGHDSQLSINDCKFTPDGRCYLLASEDACIYLYQSSGYKLLAHLRAHVAAVIHIDVSTDNNYLMSNDADGHLYFWSVKDEEVVAANVVREVDWATNNCVYSFASQKIWTLSPETVYPAIARSYDGSLLATATNHGQVRVFVAPCLKDDPPFYILNGHGSLISNCLFACDDAHLFSTGQIDGCLIQWRVVDLQSKSSASCPYLRPESLSLGDDNLKMEADFEGIALDHNAEYSDAIRDHPVAICEYEETAGEAAEEYMPWQKIIVPPSNLPIEDLSEPADALDIEFVYGLTVDRSRSSLMYSPTGEVLFFSAAIVVLMDRKKRSQRFYQGHRSTISAMAVPSVSHEQIVASGDIAENPSIRIWNPKTLQTLSVLSGYHTRAILHLAFDVSGSKLVSVGQDRYHSIAVYDWRNQQILCSCQSFINKSFFITFLSSSNTLIHGGHQIVRFYDIDGRNMHSKPAVNLPASTSAVCYTCCEKLGHRLFIGADNGYLYHFYGNHYDGQLQAHDGVINQITTTSSASHKNAVALCTCSSDGYIKIWISTPTNSLECILAVDISTSLKSISRNIRCVYSSPSNHHRILLATANAEIFEISSKTGHSLHEYPLTADPNGPSTSAILAGHGGLELWGLAINPTRSNEFCTVGDDCMLRVWDSHSHHSVVVLPLELPARACCYSPDGKVIAIGFGCPEKIKPKQYDGKWIILDTTTWQSTYEARDSKAWITVIKYSHNGEFLAMGAFDNKIYVYNTFQAYALSAVISHHASYITSLDFSDDGAWLQSNSSDHELCFFETDTGIFIPAASRLRDVSWYSQNCYMSWTTQGVWTPYRDGREPCTCESNYNHPMVESLDDGSSLAALAPILISGDNYGTIHVHRYPCTTSQAHAKRYHISSSPVNLVRMLGAGFAASDSKLLAIVGKDKCIIQFKHHRDASIDIAANSLTDSRWNPNQIEEEEDDVLDYIRPPLSVFDKNLFPKPLEAGLTNEAIAKVTESASHRYVLSRVLGMQADRCRGSLKYGIGSVGKHGSIIYPSSRYILVDDIHRHQQQRYHEHDHEVACLAISADHLIAASAEHDQRVRIHIWDAATGKKIMQLPIFHRQGVSSMEFTSNRHRLISLGKDNDYSIAVWESCSSHWSDGNLLATAKGDVHPVLFASFFNSSPIRDYDFVSGGRFHLKFWKIQGRTCIPAYPSLPDDLSLGTMLCGTQVFALPSTAADDEISVEKALVNLFASGSTSGHLHVWKGRKCIQVIRAHEGGVSSMITAANSFITGSKDGSIKIWNISYTAQQDNLSIQCCKSVSLQHAELTPLALSIRSIDAVTSSSNDSQIIKLLIGTAGGEAYELAVESGDISSVCEGHSYGELCGLSVHPIDPDIFASCGDDRSVRLWSISQTAVLCKAVLECSARAISWSADGRYLVVGMGGDHKGRKQRQDGAFLVLDGQTLAPLFEGRDAKQAILAVAFSPDSSTLAIGSMDGYLYLYGTTSYRLRGKAMIGQPVHSIDYSEDSRIIRVYSIAGERFYLDADDAMVLNAAAADLDNVPWKTRSSLYDDHVRGLWHRSKELPDEADDTIKEQSYPTTIAVSDADNDKVIAAGSRGGDIKIYPNGYPSNSSSALIALDQAHVGAVAKVAYSADMKHLISIGQYDRTILIWQIIQNKETKPDSHKQTMTPN